MINLGTILGNTIKDLEAKKYLEIASRNAKANSIDGCVKVSVGSVLVTNTGIVCGRNRTYGHNCAQEGCHRVKLYGDNSCNHRLPSDCMSIHSEIDAISAAARNGWNTKGATIYITRYPCEACARAIIAAGIKEVIFGRTQQISAMTEKMFDDAGVKVTWYKDFIEEDVIEEKAQGVCYTCVNYSETIHGGVCGAYYCFVDKDRKACPLYKGL